MIDTLYNENCLTTMKRMAEMGGKLISFLQVHRMAIQQV